MKTLVSTAELDRRRAWDRAWLGFVRDRQPPAGVPTVVGRSWLRARDDFRIDPAIRKPVRCLGGETALLRVLQEPRSSAPRDLTRR